MGRVVFGLKMQIFSKHMCIRYSRPTVNDVNVLNSFIMNIPRCRNNDNPIMQFERCNCLETISFMPLGMSVSIAPSATTRCTPSA